MKTALAILALLALDASPRPEDAPLRGMPAEGRQDTRRGLAPQAEPLQGEIDALKVARAPWREIPWKSCLAEGLRDSARKEKPVLLWVFIDRPVDDKRC